MNLQEDTLALPIFPGFKFEMDDYADLKMRLDLYTDMITATHYDNGRPREVYAVDPADMATALSNITLGSGPLPRNCLFWEKVGGQQRLGIYIEPRVWPVSVEREKETWHVPMPGLVWIGAARSYSLYAVKAGWPTAETPLYLAPCPNVWGDRGVCRGNAPFPTAGAATIWQAVEVFFGSGFNTHLDDNKSKKFKNSIITQWRALHQAGAQEYPLDDLVEGRLTLAQAMENR